MLFWLSLPKCRFWGLYQNLILQCQFKFKWSIQQATMQEDAIQKIQYLSYDQLQAPCAGNIAQAAIEMGFASREWHIQFQTLTNLRQANRHYACLFVNELLPLNYKQIIAQTDNLRSNNSKEALTLVTEIFEHQKLQNVDNNIMRALVSALMNKSVSEKRFLKGQALKGLNQLPTKWSDGALEELCVQTQAQNGQISELSIRLMSQMIQNNKQYQSDDKFLKNLSHNLNGKRSVLQKRAKQILNNLKEREGEQTLQKKISSSSQLLEEQSITLRRELKEKEQKSKGPSFKQFLKQKKVQT